MSAVLAKLKAMNIDDKDIQTSGISVWPMYDQSPNKITGYTASNTVNVTVNDISRAGEILDTAVAAGANTAGGVTFGIKGPQPPQYPGIGRRREERSPEGRRHGPGDGRADQGRAVGHRERGRACHCPRPSWPRRRAEGGAGR